jgi:hypothetical protein
MSGVKTLLSSTAFITLYYFVDYIQIWDMDIVHRSQGEVEGTLISVCEYPNTLG